MCRKRKPAFLLAGLLALSGCAGSGAETPISTPSTTPEVTATPVPAPTPKPAPEPTEEPKELWGFPMDDTHDAFEVPTGGRLGTVLVTVEGKEAESEFWGYEMTLSVWEAGNLSEPIQTMVKPMEGNVFGTHDVVDANFDGYLDFGCQYFQGNQPTYWYYWIWDETQGCFIEEPAFSVDETGQALGGICMPTFDPETETVSGYARYGMAGAVGVGTFHRWEDGHLVCVRRVATDMGEGSGDIILLVVEDRIDGRLTEVFRKEYPLSGGEAYQESEKWYDLDYHGE